MVPEQSWMPESSSTVLLNMDLVGMNLPGPTATFLDCVELEESSSESSSSSNMMMSLVSMTLAS